MTRQVRSASLFAARAVASGIEGIDESCLGVFTERRNRREGKRVGERLRRGGRLVERVEADASELVCRETRARVVAMRPAHVIETGRRFPIASGPTRVERALEELLCVRLTR